MATPAATATPATIPSAPERRRGHHHSTMSIAAIAANVNPGPYVPTASPAAAPAPIIPARVRVAASSMASRPQTVSRPNSVASHEYAATPGTKGAAEPRRQRREAAEAEPAPRDEKREGRDEGEAERLRGAPVKDPD